MMMAGRLEANAEEELFKVQTRQQILFHYTVAFLGSTTA